MPNLQRFIEAQESDYPIALAEIKAGHKENHWIWYIFPQLDGLGSSFMSKHYAIKDIEEAKEYLSHPILGTRLKEITSVLLTLPKKNPSVVMGGWPDNKKLQSCMTLFAAVSEEDSVFHKVLEAYFDGRKCEKTIEMLNIAENANV